MSISNQTARAQFIADGVNNSYVVPFKFLENSPSISGKVYQLKVFIGKAGKDTELLEGTNYSVQASTDNRITIFNAYGGNEIPRVGDVISILRDVPLNQNIELEEKHKFPVKVIEQGFDKNTMAIQEIKEKIDRAPLLPLSSPITPEEYQQSFFTARDEALESAAAAKSAATDAKNSAQEAADSVKNKMDRISADDQTQVVGTNLALAKDKEFLCTDKDGRQHNAASIGIYGDYQQFESGTEEVPYCLNHHAAPDGNIHPVANIKDNAGQIITDNLALVSDVTALDEAALKVADKITSIGSDSTDDDIPTGKATFNLVAASRNGLFLGGYWFGKTTEDFVPPVTEDMAGKNYFDFINNTAYTFDLANLTWVVKEAFTPKDTALVRITKVFWDLSADAGKPGYATYSEHSASWAYSPNTGGDSNPPDMETMA